MIISGLYIVLLLLFMVAISLARYQDTLTAYTSFGIANFNAVILGETTLEALQDTTTSPEVFGATLSTADYHPGMVWSENDEENTSEEFPFTVANGTTEENRAGGTVEYTIKLRTLGSLPLTYQLAAKTITETITTITAEDGYTYIFKAEAGTAMVIAPDGNGFYYAQGDGGYPDIDTIVALTTTNTYEYGYILYQPSEPTITYDTSGQVWYEYTFYPKDDADTTEIDESAEEARFELDGSALNLNAYSLILEWPVITESYVTVDVEGSETGETTQELDPDFIATNDTYYMKELETIEIVIAVTSKNEVGEDEETEYTITVDEDTLDLDAEGVIIIHPAAEGAVESGLNTYIYSYGIDLRSFHADDDTQDDTIDDTTSTDEVSALGFAFSLDNGVALQMEGYTEKNAKTTYTMQLKVPYTSGLKNYTFTLYEANALDAESYNGVPTTTLVGYYLYDEYTGEQVEGVTVSIDETTGEPITPVGYSSEQYAIYALYKLTFVVTTVEEESTTTAAKMLTLTNGEDPLGIAWGQTIDSDDYYLVVTKTDKSTFTEDAFDASAFSDKLELLITATYGE